MDSSYVGKPCPKCAHVRAASDTGPDWQCPKCGIAYAKLQQARSAPAAEATFPPAAASKSASASAGQSSGMAVFGHLSILLGFVIPLVNIIAPIVIIKMKRGEDEFAVACAREAINFQISILLWWLLVLGLTGLGFLFQPAIYLAILFLVVVLLCSIVLPIVAAVKASRGESYYYPLTWHIFK